MKYILLILAVLGMVVSSLALRLLGGVFDQLGIHAHIPILSGMPVATAGILGYIVMALVAFRQAYRLLLALILASLAFSLYLAHIEKDVLGVWCVYCVISLGLISLMGLLNLGTVISGFMRKPPPA